MVILTILTIKKTNGDKKHGAHKSAKAHKNKKLKDLHLPPSQQKNNEKKGL